MSAPSGAAATVRRDRLTIESPEGVPLHLTRAGLGARTGALAIDLTILATIALVILLGGVALGVALLGELAIAVVTIGLFVLRSFYFVLGELGTRGQTPGKRLVGIQVVARDGGPLTPDLVLARNLLREIELFLPLMLLGADLTIPGLPGWVSPLLLVIWIGLNAALPLVRGHGSRLGDLVAGTAVVLRPAGRLRGELAGERSAGRTTAATPSAESMPHDPATGDPGPTFTAGQLDVYGVRELQILEDVLRRDASTMDAELLPRVAERIRSRIGWEGPVTEPEVFLRAFYRAQRARLEQELRLGRRRQRRR